ncbi:M48 family metallopeptidase [Puniceicoccales bacterium CK1056]|uniref:M48 family metallopeptidase n=1 Tax=Oceanipulchritudo coccoides TaxID=2706888 RepID=A0A6B2LYC5_9BACT|nr:SprT family zinc-dependent metalloprotease [Oceanipulchritudo coccoides]NDV61086.1 M48 family metallopeptidase [Oceanipulchritudo coccoides]
MKIEPSEQILVYGERRIPYRLQFSDRKRLRITVKPDLNVVANAPSHYSEEEAREAVRSKARWILRQLASFQEFHPLPMPHKYISGETFVYLGRQYRLKVETGDRTPAKLRGRYLFVTVPDRTDSTKVKAAVDAWYRVRAEEVFRRYLEACMEVAGRHGISEPELSIRNMRTRWGSCSSAGRITLNLKLIYAPVHCIEYVIMHELCHLAHHDHSPRFYRLLTRCMPDWEKRRKVLSQVVFLKAEPLRL